MVCLCLLEANKNCILKPWLRGSKAFCERDAFWLRIKQRPMLCIYKNMLSFYSILYSLASNKNSFCFELAVFHNFKKVREKQTISWHFIRSVTQIQHTQPASIFLSSQAEVNVRERDSGRIQTHSVIQFGDVLVLRLSGLMRGEYSTLCWLSQCSWSYSCWPGHTSVYPFQPLAQLMLLMLDGW